MIIIHKPKKYPEITLSGNKFCAQARKWEMSHGGSSGRAAQQLMNHMSGIADK